MRGFKYGFFDELLKLAATAEELNAASERMRRNAGILTTDEVIGDKLPVRLQPFYDKIKNNPGNLPNPISPSAVRPESHAAAGYRDQYSGVMTSPSITDDWVYDASNPQRKDIYRKIYQPVNDAFNRGEIDQQGRDQLLRNHSAIVNHHETREGLEARRSKTRPSIEAIVPASDRINTIAMDVDRRLEATPTMGGDLKTIPVMNLDPKDVNVMTRAEGNSYFSHISPKLPIEDIRQAHTMGRSSALAKSVNNSPDFRRQIEAHQQGMGRENMLARLKAKRAGDPNWRQARATTGVVAETAQQLIPTKDMSMINMRGGGAGVVSPELGPMATLLHRSGDKSNSWVADPRMAPYLKGDKPLSPWMKKSMMRNWDRTPVGDRARFFKNYGVTAQWATPAKRGAWLKERAANIMRLRKAYSKTMASRARKRRQAQKS